MEINTCAISYFHYYAPVKQGICDNLYLDMLVFVCVCESGNGVSKRAPG